MRHEIYFDRPSDNYTAALPVGTGRLGAMVSGAIAERQIWINEETAWFGGPRDRINPDALDHIAEIKRLVQTGRTREAEQLAVLTLTGTPESQRHYTTLGLVFLSFSGHEGTSEDYDHRLDFTTATTCTRYRINGVSYEMQVHANQPESALIIRLKASAPVIDFYAGIERGERVAQFSYGTHQDEIIRHAQNGVIMTGTCGGRQGLEFSAALFAESNGQTSILGDKIVVKCASEAVLYVTAATTFTGEDSTDLVIRQAIAARAKGWEICYQNHLSEWMPLYARAAIDLKPARTINLPPQNRLFELLASDKDLMQDLDGHAWSKQELYDDLVLLLFHFGRYILLSCSRKCQLPASLQGIWCRDLLPVWDGKFTTNINLQMAYWPADSSNLSDCFEPYIRLAERIRESGLVTAQRMYNCRGFVLHNNTDIWADTAVQDSGPHCSYWFLGGVWIAIDMFEHFRYTRDPQFLSRVWPILRDAALFVLDFMEEKNDGSLVMGVTTSPENFYYNEAGERTAFCEMSAMDTQLITLQLNQCIEAIELLSAAFEGFAADAGFITEVKTALTKIEPLQIGSDGTILEWTAEVKEAEPAHRHSSHVIGAYPYNGITEKQPELYAAAIKSVVKRRKNGGYNTGWGYAWGAGLLARFKRGDEARDMLADLLKQSGQPNLFSCCNIRTVPKLLDNNKPMQVDGTLGLVQSVVELLLQSYQDNEMQLLPALPASWTDGSFKGLVARGNIVVDAMWQDGKLSAAILMPRFDTETTIVSADEFTVTTPDGPVRSTEGKVTVRLSAGKTYHIQRVD